MIRYILSPAWHSQKSLIKHFQGQYGIFRNIDTCSVTLTGVKLGRRGEASTAFLKIKKEWLGFGKKCSDYIHHWVKFSIQNVVLRVYRRKNSKIFPLWIFFKCYLPKCFYRSALVLQTSPHTTALQNLWLRTCNQALIFLQNAPSFDNVCQCFEYISVS